MFKKISIVLALTLSGIIITPTLAQNTPLDSVKTRQPLKVGVAGTAPFVMNNNLEPTGISVEIWQEAATRSQLTYQLIPLDKVKTGLKDVSEGKLDILIGSVSITAQRLKTVDFTQPYFQADIGLLVTNNNPSLWNRIKPLFGIAVISSVGVLFLALFIMGNLIWLTEHRRNEQFPKAYLPGLANGIWFSLVTLTTVGYGDKTPITRSGRIITSVWLLITAVAASSLTAGLASALTIFLSGNTTEKFTRPVEIENQRIAVVEGTTGEYWGETYNARLIKAPNLEKAIEKLSEGTAEGVIFDVPALEYYLSQNPEKPFKIANITFASENYGFVLPLDSPLMNDINIAIIALKESGRLEEISQEALNITKNP